MDRLAVEIAKYEARPRHLGGASLLLAWYSTADVSAKGDGSRRIDRKMIR
jgi:hypothetical protein